MLTNVIKKISDLEKAVVTAAAFGLATVLYLIAEEVSPASWLFVHQEETPEELL